MENQQQISIVDLFFLVCKCVVRFFFSILLALGGFAGWLIVANLLFIERSHVLFQNVMEMVEILRMTYCFKSLLFSVDYFLETDNRSRKSHDP